MKNLCLEGLGGRKWVYALNRLKDKKFIPDGTCQNEAVADVVPFEQTSKLSSCYILQCLSYVGAFTFNYMGFDYRNSG